MQDDCDDDKMSACKFKIEDWQKDTLHPCHEITLTSSLSHETLTGTTRPGFCRLSALCLILYHYDQPGKGLVDDKKN